MADSSKLGNAETVSVVEDVSSGVEDVSSVETLASEDAGPRVARALPPGTPRGRYLILDPLGEGGMGVVYAAYDPQLNRKVALKLMRSQPGAEGTFARSRLLREAQALAQLSHPNVVAAYDVGTHGDDVFIAMELVEGETLHALCKKKLHRWQELVALCLQAGRGLAAAHAAGIVHRDFKPDNVIIGKDGRARVVDFGIARASGEREPSGARPSSETIPTGLLGTPLTQAGTLIGTPRYMSPEQLLTAETGAPSDQFSFCLTVYEALYGELPFDGDTQGSLLASMKAERVRPAPPGTRVPERIREVLLAGLRLRPEDRHPSMDALLEALAKAAIDRRARRIAMFAGALALVVAVGGFAAVRAQHRRECDAGRARFAKIWNPVERASVERAFRATGLSYAGDVIAGVTRALDGYAAKFGESYRETCSATLIDGTQPEAVMHARLDCLSAQAGAAETLIDSFKTATPELASRAVGAVHALPKIAACGRAEARLPMPDDPAARATILDVRAKLGVARGVRLAGKIDEAQKQMHAVADAAHATHYAPLEAEADMWLSSALQTAGDLPGAEAALRRAIVSAERGRADDVAADSWSLLASLVGYWEGHPQEGLQLADFARAAIDRAGADPRQLGGHLTVTGDLLWEAKKKPEALKSYEESIAMLERALANDDPQLSLAYANAIPSFVDAGDLKTALRYAERAVAIDRGNLGPHHPEVADSLSWLAYVSEVARAYGRAEEANREALAILDGTHLPREYEVRAQLGWLYLAERRDEDAAKVLAPAIAPGTERVNKKRAMALAAVAEVARRRGDLANARARVAEAQALDAKSDYLTLIAGLIALDAGQRDVAQKDLEAAAKALAAPTSFPRLRATTQLALARALPAAENARARKLAGDAAAEFRLEGELGAPDAKAADEWLALNPTEKFSPSCPSCPSR